jgi:hypothetical protein
MRWALVVALGSETAVERRRAGELCAVNLALAAILPTTDTKMSGELVPDEDPDPAPSHCLIHHLHVAKEVPECRQR